MKFVSFKFISLIIIGAVFGYHFPDTVSDFLKFSAYVSGMAGELSKEFVKMLI